MVYAVILNIVVILALAGLVSFFTVGDRVVAFLTVLWALVCISPICWMIFVAVHFAGKYW